MRYIFSKMRLVLYTSHLFKKCLQKPGLRHLVGPRLAHDMVNPRMLELEDAKEILSELFDIRTREVDEIRQRMEERTLYDREFNL